MSAAVIVIATSINMGGGLVLLRQMITETAGQDDIVFLCDLRAREMLADLGDSRLHWIPQGLRGRWGMMRALHEHATAKTEVLAFHGIPPFGPFRGRLSLFVQNAYYVGNHDDSLLSISRALKVRIVRLLMRLRHRRISRVIVQTPTMAIRARDTFGKDITVEIAPFAPSFRNEAGASQQRREGYLYVADGVAHKNHDTLAKAWIILAQRGHRPALRLSLNESDSRMLSIRALVQGHDVHIEALGTMSHADLMAEYGRARGLVYPSLVESFGLPLLEATATRLPIIASELDFVRDVCVPDETFNPLSPLSIARAVERHMGVSPAPITVTKTATFFRMLRDRDAVHCHR